MANLSNLRRGGSPGRPRGVPNKATARLKTFIVDLVEEAMADPQFKNRLVSAIARLELDPKVLQLLLAYGYGKPVAAIDVRVGPSLAELITGTFVPDYEDDQDGRHGMSPPHTEH